MIIRWGVECVSLSDNYCLTTDTKQLSVWDHHGILINRLKNFYVAIQTVDKKIPNDVMLNGYVMEKRMEKENFLNRDGGGITSLVITDLVGFLR